MKTNSFFGLKSTGDLQGNPFLALYRVEQGIPNKEDVTLFRTYLGDKSEDFKVTLQRVETGSCGRFEADTLRQALSA